MKITDEIYQVGGSGFSSPEDAAIYLIVFGKHAALIDAGCGRSLEQGNDTVTAANWYGSSLKPFCVDRKLTGSREIINLGGRNIEAIHVPGHSPGSVVYLTESDGEKVLFAQDVHGPLDSSFLSNKKDYLKSLKFLLSLEADILCEGHFGIYKGKKEVAKFIESFLTAL
jgi:glyoxylase-like metal-dependent hydrolase (beta-lactamase superfamily II)